MEPENLSRAEELLGYTFKDRTLLLTALTHASIADTRVVSNERLEFLGDAVLGLITCEHLYRRFTDLLEGELTKIKSSAVSRNAYSPAGKSAGITNAPVFTPSLSFQRSHTGATPYMRAVSVRVVRVALTFRSTRSPRR